MDYNLYFMNGKSSYSLISWKGTDYATLNAFRAAVPNLETHGIQGDPLFISTSADNFQLTPTSPCIHTGAGLGSPYNIDLLGMSRPVGAVWDIGAYEYQPQSGLTQPLAPPKNLRFKQS